VATADACIEATHIESDSHPRYLAPASGAHAVSRASSIRWLFAQRQHRPRAREHHSR